MAIYQFRFIMVPRRGIENKDGNIPLRISEGEINRQNPWQGIELDESLFDSIAPRTTSWSENIHIWGEEHGSCIEVLFEDSCIVEMDISVDVRGDYVQFVSQLIGLAGTLDCLFFIDNNRLIEPQIDIFMEVVYHSKAYRFTQNQREAIPLYSQNRINKAMGCIFGGAIGDAIAGPYEGQRPPIIYDDKIHWRLSDDTQFTLATCEAIIKAQKVDPAIIAEYFLEWFREGKITGIGASTLKAMRDLEAGAHWAMAGRTGEYAAGNGAAMRIAPVALMCNYSPNLFDEEGKRFVRHVCSITHKNDEAYIGALALGYAIDFAAEESWIPGMPLLSRIAKLLPDTRIKDQLIKISSLETYWTFKEIAHQFGCGGYVVESVPIALLAVEEFLEEGFEKVMMECIEIGGDTDTISSMAGQVAGAFLGKSGLPGKWLQRLPEKNMINDIVTQFAEVYARS